MFDAMTACCFQSRPAVSSSPSIPRNRQPFEALFDGLPFACVGKVTDDGVLTGHRG